MIMPWGCSIRIMPCGAGGSGAICDATVPGMAQAEAMHTVPVTGCALWQVSGTKKRDAMVPPLRGVDEQCHLRHHRLRNVAHAHQRAGFAAYRFHAFQECPVRVELDGGLVAGLAERFGAHQDHGHRDVHATHVDAVDNIERLAGGQHFLR